MANRLPVHRTGSGEKGRWESSAGGLVTAMAPVLKKLPGVWVGWSGDDSKARPFTHERIRIRPVALGREEIAEYYDGMSNRTLWPLYHDAIRAPEFQRRWWKGYAAVNRRFAQAAAAEASPGDLVWVHDYHLQLLPAMLRRLRPDVRIGFFLHIPFPPEELFEWLPWREEILKGLLGADVIGFQTGMATHNFARLCRHYVRTEGAGATLKYENRTIVNRAFPVSIDFDWFDIRAKSPGTEASVADIRRLVGRERKILLSVDRLDYTKGVVRRLQAFEELLERGLASVEDCVMIQIATPSREAVPEYKILRKEVETLVGRINGKFSRPGRVAVHYFRRTLTREELITYYAATDVMLVTPLRDGMNLVAKEYVACRFNNDGVLVLSQFAGASRELTRALIVNPRDQDQFVEALRTALKMPRDEARMRMGYLRGRVKRHDVYGWCDDFLSALRGDA